jgi:hypothetical protein
MALLSEEFDMYKNTTYSPDRELDEPLPERPKVRHGGRNSQSYLIKEKAERKLD